MGYCQQKKDHEDQQQHNVNESNNNGNILSTEKNLTILEYNNGKDHGEGSNGKASSNDSSSKIDLISIGNINLVDKIIPTKEKKIIVQSTNETVFEKRIHNSDKAVKNVLCNIHEENTIIINDNEQMLMGYEKNSNFILKSCPQNDHNKFEAVTEQNCAVNSSSEDESLCSDTDNNPVTECGDALQHGLVISNSNSKTDSTALTPVPEEVTVKNFNLLKVVGKGAFGDVFLVRKKNGADSGALYALKMIYKHKIQENHYYDTHFRSERKALEAVRDGIFLSTLYYAFQTVGHLYLVMDYNSGGQLLQQFIGNNVLFENHMKVYLAELLVAVDYLHSHGIIHRDIKPENVLLDSEGHVVLIDYGLSKLMEGTRNESHVGTEPYIAPEILLHKPHDRVADFWSLGVLGYEMVAGVPPFDLEQSDDKLRRAVLQKEPKFSSKMFHNACKSLLAGLMQKNPKQRLGAVNKGGQGGMKAVMGHKFFKFINWSDVSERKLKPPNIPKKEKLTNLKESIFVEPKPTEYRNHFEDYSFSWLPETSATTT